MNKFIARRLAAVARKCRSVACLEPPVAFPIKHPSESQRPWPQRRVQVSFVAYLWCHVGLPLQNPLEG